MKRILPKLLILILAVLIVVSLAACHKKAAPQEEEKPNEYEDATYNVTFVSNGLTDFSKYNLKDVPFGTYISAPKDADGRIIKPTRTGYSFSYWSSDGQNEYNFETTPVTGDITLTAVYLPLTYEHPFDITAHLVQSLDDEGNVVFRVESGVYAGGTLGEDEELLSIYNYTSTDLPIPTTTVAGDRFMFWYYIDGDGKPQEFSTTAPATQSATTRVSELKTYNNQNFAFVNFASTKKEDGLKLYAMWYSELAKITVVYNDSLSDTTYGQFEYSQTDYAVESQAPNMKEAKTGYIFDKWYYKAKDSEGNEQQRTFVFDDVDDPDCNPTNLTAAAGIESTFESGTLNLYASWKKIVSIASKDDYDALYDIMHGDSSDEEKATILNATIYFAGNIDLGTAEYEPLFDSEHRFTGVIDGGRRDESGAVQESAKLIGGVFGDGKSASVLGYLAGELAYLDFENTGLKFVIPETGNVTFSAAVVATLNSGTINYVNVDIDSLTIDVEGSSEVDGRLNNGLASVLFGGIVARNNGEIRNVNVNLTATSLSESLVLGGVAGTNTARISEANANLHLTSVKCLDNNKSADGIPFVQIGGITASNSGTISSANVLVTESVSGDKFDFGGIAASNLGNISRSASNVSCTATTKGYTNVGGLVGSSDGDVKNCLSAAAFDIDFKGTGNVLVGGLVGNNGLNSAGNLSYSYATGSINLDCEDGATVFVGGVVGRNIKKSKIEGYFSAVDITVQNEGMNSVGALFGDDGNVTSVSVGWYAEDITVTVNAEAVQELGIGTATERANLKSAEFVIGKDSTVKFDSTVWKIEGDAYPVFVG